MTHQEARKAIVRGGTLVFVALAVSCTRQPPPEVPIPVQVPPPPPPPPAMEVPLPPLVRPFTNAKHWLLNESMVYRIGTTSDSVIVPAGFVTDFASIPAPLQGIIQPLGPVLTPAIVHDYLYWEQGCTRAEADRIFNLAMRETGVTRGDRVAIFNAVRGFGGAAYRDNAQERAQGKPRVIPEPFRRIPAAVPWPDYQRTLMQQGIRARPPASISPAFCAWGRDGVVVPGVPE